MSERVMIISSDCHGGPQPAVYRGFLEARYQDDLDRYLSEQSEIASVLPAKRPGMEDREERVAFATEMESRLPILEADGIVAEVIFPDGNTGNEIPFTGIAGGVGSRYSLELQTAAQRAYNRWLGTHCEPGRQVGLGLIPLFDPELATAEVKRTREYGLRGIYPIYDGGDGGPQLYDPEFDPMWAACVDDSLTVNFHVGSGTPFRLYDSERGRRLVIFDVRFWGRRALWLMTLGGVFERHPDLKVVFTELQADWLPPTLKQMDELWEGRLDMHELCPGRPSEYWYRRGFVGASAVSRYELEMLDELGVERLMFGTDHVHSTATWKCTTEYLQLTFGAAGVAESDARAILGENIARLYDLDVSQLSAIAERVGPPAEEILAKPSSQTMEKVPEYLRRTLAGLADRRPGSW